MAVLRNRVRLRFAPCACVPALARGLAAFLAIVSAPALAHDNEVDISVRGGLRCITSNGLPNHDTGRFPNSGNPNSISEQAVSACRGHEQNAGCSFTVPHDGRRISGSCRTTPGGFACVPDSRRP